MFDGKAKTEKLIDFGLAKLIPEGATHIPSLLLGTYQNMSPEEIQEPYLISYPRDLWGAG